MNKTIDRPLRLLDAGIGLVFAGLVTLMGAVLVKSLAWYAALAQIGMTFVIGGIILSFGWWYYS